MLFDGYTKIFFPQVKGLQQGILKTKVETFTLYFFCNVMQNNFLLSYLKRDDKSFHMRYAKNKFILL